MNLTSPFKTVLPAIAIAVALIACAATSDDLSNQTLGERCSALQARIKARAPSAAADYNHYTILRCDTLLASSAQGPGVDPQECARCVSSGAADCHAQCMSSSAVTQETGLSPPSSAQGPEEIQIERRGSAYYVPVRINNTITLPFLLDTGAGDLAIPEDVARTLIRAGALRRSDLVGNRSYQMASGSEEVSPLVAIREVRVGDHVVRNVTAGITPPNGEPLLGQSFLSKFGTVTIDYKRLVLILSP